MWDRLLKKRLVFVTGKGGVGKSTASAALASAFAEQGRRTLVVETDTFSAMTEMLGVTAPPSTTPHRVSERLDVVNLSAAECLVSTLTRFLPSERIVRAITQNRVTEAFFKSAPAVSEFVLLDQIQLYVDEMETSGYDHVIVDLPASGHAVTFLNVPKTLHDMMRGRGPIAKRAVEIHQQIQKQKETAIVAVCLPEEMPVNETVELAGAIRDTLGRGLDLVIANMVHDSPIEPTQRAAFGAVRRRVHGETEPAEALAEDDMDGLGRLIAGSALALDWTERDRHYLGVLADKLDVEIVEVPVFYEIDARRLLERMTRVLLHGDDDDEANLAS